MIATPFPTATIIERLLARPTPEHARFYGLADGLAGYAYAAWRLAHLTGRSDLLDSAISWSQAAVNAIPVSGPVRTRNGEEVSPRSVLFAQAGVYFTDAVIRATARDYDPSRTSLQAFINVSHVEGSNLDVTLGRAGTLIACIFLLQHAPRLKSANLVDLLEFSYDELSKVIIRIQQPLRECSEIEGLPFAHGVAGILHALLRYHEFYGTHPSGPLERSLEMLAACSAADGEGAWWPPKEGMKPNADVMRECWCNGSAGFVLLWALAARLCRSDDYLMLARRAAFHAGQCRVAEPFSVCCGIGGKAWALLAMHRACGEERWLRRARRLLEAAWEHAEFHSSRGVPLPFSGGLFYGSLGVGLLAAEIENPSGSRFPLYE